MMVSLSLLFQELSTANGHPHKSYGSSSWWLNSTFSQKVSVENWDVSHVVILTLNAMKGNCVQFAELCS